LDENAVRSAVVAHIRHVETEYDELLARGSERHAARAQVGETIQLVLARWQARRMSE
jgi:hypothetical protein